MESVSTSKRATTSSLRVSHASAQPHRSPWHSPVPYLFGGLAAMLCLIMFALLILAYTYRRHSGRQGGNRDIGSRDGGEKEGDFGMVESVQAYQEKILVIMAGDENPTYLATPVCAYCSSLGHGIKEDFKREDKNHENCQTTDKQTYDHVPNTSTTPPENEGIQETQQHN